MTRSRMLLIGAAALVAIAALSAYSYQASQHAAHRQTHPMVVVGDGDNGKRVTIRVGDELKVVLESTYWTIAGSSNASVLSAEGIQVDHPRLRGCVPGEGCGIAAREFVAEAAGTVTLTAGRTSCGEALRCTGTNGSYSVTVTVRA